MVPDYWWLLLPIGAIFGAAIALYAVVLVLRHARKRLEQGASVEAGGIRVQQWPGIDGPPPEGWGRRV